MNMVDFNLQTLYNFRPAQYLCENCRGLLVHAPVPKKDANPQCPLCTVEYVPCRQWSRYAIDQYLASQGLELKFPNLLQHCMDLAHRRSVAVHSACCGRRPCRTDSTAGPGGSRLYGGGDSP